jgi:hypothetical protein
MLQNIIYADIDVNIINKEGKTANHYLCSGPLHGYIQYTYKIHHDFIRKKSFILFMHWNKLIVSENKSSVSMDINSNNINKNLEIITNVDGVTGVEDGVNEELKNNIKIPIINRLLKNGPQYKVFSTRELYVYIAEFI